MKKTIFAFLCLGLFAGAAFADVRMPDAPPTPAPTATPQTDVQLRIVLNSNVKQARLVIPRDHLKDLLAASGQTSGANTAAVGGFSRAQTAIGGFFLSLAFLAGGVWVARGRRADASAGKTVAFGGVFLAGVFATATFGNVAPPPVEARSITSLIFDREALQRRAAYGDIKLEVKEGDGSVYLYVPLVEGEKKNKEE